jgi:hypothetical protein
MGSGGAALDAAGPAGKAPPDGWHESLVDGAHTVRCYRCGTGVAVHDATEPLASLSMATLPLGAAGPHIGDGRLDPGFDLRQYCCPACGRSLQVARTRSVAA